jgi:hypothetical protein
MSDAARRPNCPGVASCARAALLLFAFAGPVLPQEDLGRLRAEVEAIHARERVADSTIRAISRRRTTTVETLHVEGIRIRISPAGMPKGDIDPIAKGIRSGLTALESRFGVSGRALIDTAEWRVSQSMRLARWARPLSLEAGRGTSRTDWRLNRPLTPAQVEAFISRRAGERLAFRSPALGGYAGSGFSLGSSDVRLALAAREMSVSSAGPMRRCAIGSLADCRRIIVRPARDTLSAWYDPHEHQVAVTFSVLPFVPADPRRQVRTACLAGDDAACTTLATSLKVNPPFSTLVPHTFLEYAFDVGGSGMIDSLVGATGEPLAVLARATGIPEDSLILGWQRRAFAALDAGHESPFIILLSSVTWSVIFLGVAARKRGESR